MTLDAATVGRLEAASARFTIVWAESHRGRPGNPLGIEIRAFGNATAVAARERPDLDFMNIVVGLGSDDAGKVEAIAGFYRRHGLRARIELPPDAGARELMQAMTRQGGAQVGFWTRLVAPAAHGRADSRVHVVAPGEASLFGRVWAEGMGIPEGEREAAGGSAATWVDDRELICFLAESDGEAGAAAALLVHDRVGFLAIASTRPHHRRRGLQAALIAARIQAAGAAGCDLVSALCEFGSDSQRNLERAGLTVAYTPAVWRL
ncbi:MAG TPA: GNAT family N-acetyltransferase [Gaiellales bacterium]|nr:GNAT family N-acetyltransferase [Gaiellales bacterium]